jgi:DeoR/GlpR family transcriptional regulator of sugar metabolism
MALSRRRVAIEQRLMSAGESSYLELAEEFGVSEMTIRRDVEALERDGRVRRILGGAIPFRAKAEEPSFESRLLEASQEKEHIAEAVVALFEKNETVILDSGSTVLAVARSIAERNLELTVVTPSILVAVELSKSPKTTTFLTGGRLRHGELSLIGAESEQSLSRYNCDTYVIGVAGIDETRGLTDYHSEESAVKRAALNFADRVIVPADSSKLGKIQLINVAPFEARMTIVSDGPEDHPTLEAARRAGAQVVSC